MSFTVSRFRSNNRTHSERVIRNRTERVIRKRTERVIRYELLEKRTKRVIRKKTSKTAGDIFEKRTRPAKTAKRGKVARIAGFCTLAEWQHYWLHWQTRPGELCSKWTFHMENRNGRKINTSAKKVVLRRLFVLCFIYFILVIYTLRFTK